MKTTSYLCLFVVILIQSVKGFSISCTGGNCEPVGTVTKVIKKTDGTKPTTVTTTPGETTVYSTTVSTEWSKRRVICPPFHPYQSLLEVFRRFSVENTNVPTNVKPTKPTKPIYYLEFLKRLLKSPKSPKLIGPTNTPTQDATAFEKTEILPTTSRQMTTAVPPTQSAYVAKQPSSTTTEIPHIFAWRLK